MDQRGNPAVQQQPFGHGHPPQGQPAYIQQPYLQQGPPQPQQPQWMPAPPAIPGCPPGLEYLTQIDQVLVNQKVEILEMMTGIETNNKFVLKNSMGQQIFRCEEGILLSLRKDAEIFL